MDIDFIRKRITELRLAKDCSEYQVSLDLGFRALPPVIHCLPSGLFWISATILMLRLRNFSMKKQH